MFGMKLRRRGCFVGSLALMAGLALAALAQAGKPGGGGAGGAAPAGTIYFNWWSKYYYTGDTSIESYGLWAMDGAGGGKQRVQAPGGPLYSSDHLGYRIHGGTRWWLGLRQSPTYPLRSALYAVSESDGTEVLLQEIAELPGDPLIGSRRWSKDDSMIAISLSDSITYPDGRQAYDPDGSNTVFIADVYFDAISGVPSLDSAWDPMIEGLIIDWSPSHQAIICSTNPIKVADWSTGTLVTWTVTQDGSSPHWSPDGEWIAFKPYGQGVHLIHPDGSGLVRLTRNEWDYPIDWSPDGSQVLYWRGAVESAGGLGEIRDVMRVPATGGKEVNLTRDIDGQAQPIGWR